MKLNPNQGVRVIFPEPITQEENTIAAMLLYVAKEHPEAVTEKKHISCDAINIPYAQASKFSDCLPTGEYVTIPAADFRRVINKLVKAKLQCTLRAPNGKIYTKSAPYLPVEVWDFGSDIEVCFTEQPQCYFDFDAETNTFSLVPTGEMKQFMLDFVHKYYKKGE